MWSNPGKGLAPSPRCSSYLKGSLRITFDYSCQLYFLRIIIISSCPLAEIQIIIIISIIINATKTLLYLLMFLINNYCE